MGISFPKQGGFFFFSFDFIENAIHAFGYGYGYAMDSSSLLCS